MAQMLLRSRALEISVEGCVWTPAPPGGEVLLADVLRAFLDPGLSPGVPSLLASKVTELSGVLAQETQAARSAATAALAALVSALKAPHERPGAGVSPSKPHSSSSSKQMAPAEATAALAAVDSELAAQQAALARAVTARDRAQAAKRVLSLSDRRLELVTGADGSSAMAGGTNAAAVQAAIRDLSAWTSVIGASTKVCPARRPSRALCTIVDRELAVLQSCLSSSGGHWHVRTAGNSALCMGFGRGSPMGLKLA